MFASHLSEEGLLLVKLWLERTGQMGDFALFCRNEPLWREEEPYLQYEEVQEAAAQFFQKWQAEKWQADLTPQEQLGLKIHEATHREVARKYIKERKIGC